MFDVGKDYREKSKHESDIKGHMDYLMKNAYGSVLELGVRDGYSTTALLLGVEGSDGHLFSVDKNQACGRHYSGHPNWTFINAYSTDVEDIETKVLEAGYPFQFDLIFLDTLHSYEQVSLEIGTYLPKLNSDGQIVVHDVTTYRGAGDACRYYAVREKLDFQIIEGWNGLGILKRRDKK